MNKADLVEKVFQALETAYKESEGIVEVIFASVVRALRADDKVEVRGFGSFHTRLRAGRTARNPKTGARVNVPPKRIPFFKPSKDVLVVLKHRTPDSYRNADETATFSVPAVMWISGRLARLVEVTTPRTFTRW